MRQRFEQLFVDATDTLLRVRGSVGRLYAPLARARGIEIEAEAVDAAFRPALRAAPPPCFPNADPSRFEELERTWWHDLVCGVFASLGVFTAPRRREDLEGFDAFFDEVYALFRTPAAWELLPGAGEALRELHGEGRRLGIISEMDGRLFDVLAAFGLESLFDPIVLSMRAGCSKRDGAIYAYALAHTPVPAGQCLHIGDHLEWDVEAARAAGLAVVRFDARERGGAPPDVPVARRWAEIPPLVRILEADR